MSLRAVNLNLFPILQALLRERSIVGAAAALDLSPAATSEALTRLRSLLDDPLLVRVGRGMELTAAAVALIEPVNRLCADAESLLAQPDRFEPRQCRQHFHIASSDALVFVFASRILEAVQAQAPSVEVHFVDADSDVCAKMGARKVDLMLMPRLFSDGLGSAAPMRSRTVMRDRLVVAFSADHPLAAKAELTADDVTAYPQVMFNPSATGVVGEGRVERQVFGAVQFNVVMRVSQLILLPFLVARPPYVALISHSVIDSIGDTLGLQFREANFGTCDLDICLGWSPLRDTDPAHRWFRDLVIDVIAS